MYRGDEVVVLPRYDFDLYLNAIARFKVQQLHIVPPILIQMLSNKEKCMKFDLGNIRLVHVGAAPLAQDTITELLDLYPNWKVGQGYGIGSRLCIRCVFKLMYHPRSHGSIARRQLYV